MGNENSHATGSSRINFKGRYFKGNEAVCYQGRRKFTGKP